MISEFSKTLRGLLHIGDKRNSIGEENDLTLTIWNPVIFFRPVEFSLGSPIMPLLV